MANKKNELKKKEGSALASLTQDELEEERERTQKSGDIRPARLRIQKESLKFEDPNTGEIFEELIATIIDHRPPKAFWEVEPGAPLGRLPACSSADGVRGFDREEQKWIKCVTCPRNRFGSAGAGKACKEMRWLFLALKDKPLPYLLSLPPTSIRNFQGYLTGLLNSGIPNPVFVQTLVRLEKATSQGGYAFARVTFERGEGISYDEYKLRKEQRGQLETALPSIEIVEEDYT